MFSQPAHTGQKRVSGSFRAGYHKLTVATANPSVSSLNLLSILLSRRSGGLGLKPLGPFQQLSAIQLDTISDIYLPLGLSI